MLSVLVVGNPQVNSVVQYACDLHLGHFFNRSSTSVSPLSLDPKGGETEVDKNE